MMVVLGSPDEEGPKAMFWFIESMVDWFSEDVGCRNEVGGR